jgi:apolipoprotein N-acyltransferase
MSRIERSAWLLAILSAILQVVIFPLPDLYVLSWIAVAPLLIAILRAHRRQTLQLQGAEKFLPASLVQGFVLGYVSGILWYIGSCYWIYSTMKQYGGLNMFEAAGILFLFSLYLGLYNGLFG